MPAEPLPERSQRANHVKPGQVPHFDLTRAEQSESHMKTRLTTACALVLAGAASASGPTIPIADLEHGRMVTVTGTVLRITDEHEFRLTDPTGTIRVYVGANWVPAHVGEAVTVSGLVDRDIGPLGIHAHSLTRATGVQVTFDN